MKVYARTAHTSRLGTPERESPSPATYNVESSSLTNIGTKIGEAEKFREEKYRLR